MPSWAGQTLGRVSAAHLVCWLGYWRGHLVIAILSGDQMLQLLVERNPSGLTNWLQAGLKVTGQAPCSPGPGVGCRTEATSCVWFLGCKTRTVVGRAKQWAPS